MYDQFYEGIARRFGAPDFVGGSFGQRNEFRNAYNAAEAAQGARYGSIASRNDPNQYGTVASRQFPDLFGPQGALNPQYRQEQKAAQDQAEQRRQVGAQEESAQRQGIYTAQALSPLITSLMSSTQRKPVGSGVSVRSPYPERDDELDTGNDFKQPL